jgi:uncharacterized protein (TIGR01777 family)
MSKILVTGATGFVGRAVVLRLLREGHRVTAWVRSPESARARLGAEVGLVDAAGGERALVAAVDGADAVVNLAGEPVTGRWTSARRRRIHESRVDSTRRLVAAIERAPRRPQVLISASAVGYYGDRGDTPLGEDSRSGDGFLAEICTAWEDAARVAESLGVRVMCARLGVVLGLGGGFLGATLPLFRAGLAVRLGPGRQFIPWIHLDDVAAAVTLAISDERFTGPVDLVAGAVPMDALLGTVARAVGRRAQPRVPAALLRFALGESAAMLLASQRVQGQRLRALGFAPRFPDLDAALDDVRGRLEAVQIDSLDERYPAPAERDPYLDERRPAYLLRSRVVLDAPVEQVFDFFSRPENLGLLTPAAMSFRIQRAPKQVAPGEIIDYSLRVSGAPLRWRTVIARWVPGRLFVDAQEQGPYRAWWHEHHFLADGPRTVMEDRVYYAPPLGWLGRLAQRLLVAPQLREVFGYRAQAIGLRFRTV